MRVNIILGLSDGETPKDLARACRAGGHNCPCNSLCFCPFGSKDEKICRTVTAENWEIALDCEWEKEFLNEKSPEE